MSLEKLAKFISVALGPHVWLLVLFTLIIFNSALTTDQIKIIFPSVFILQVIIPIIYLIVAPKLGWVGEWDMKKKEERKPLFILMFVLTCITLFVIYSFGSKLLLNLNIIFISLLVILFVITNYWKISLHVSLNTAASLIINFLFSWNLPALYLVIPVVFWARLKLKKHTVNQLIAGVVVTLLIILGGLTVFGYF